MELDFDAASNVDWHTEGLHVRIKIPVEDESIHVGMIGIIQSISVIMTFHRIRDLSFIFLFCFSHLRMAFVQCIFLNKIVVLWFH